MRSWPQLVGFLVLNLVGVGLLAFAEHPALRIIGWLEVSVAISFAGIVSVIGASRSDG